jgi:EAL and modified HD-GYP domain-containing signal transduction protein
MPMELTWVYFIRGEAQSMDELRPVPPPASATSQAGLYCLARQPILDLARRTVGYELLFRKGFESVCSTTDGDMATSCTLDTSILYGLDGMCGGLPGWVNCTRTTLTKEYLSLLPPKLTVVEVLEAVPADQEVLAACKKLKQGGYTIALDDFVPTAANEPLTHLADLLKVDFRTTPYKTCGELAARYKRRGLKMVAEKVETAQEFELAVAMGYSLFQGYFFCKPLIITKTRNSTNSLTQLRLLQILHKPVLDYAEVERAIKQDPQLCYRLLRLVNSAAFAATGQINSIQHAMNLLGEDEIRKWISLVVIVALAQGKPDELVKAALIRSRFCEMEAPKLHCPEADLFLLGLLSLMDAILDMPMGEVLAKISIDAEVGAALLGENNKFRRVLDLVRAYDCGDWTSSCSVSQELRLDEEELPADYLNAVRWAAAVLAPDQATDNNCH